MNEPTKNYKKKISNIFRNRNLLVLDVLIVVMAYFGSFILVHDVFESMQLMLANVGTIAVSAVVFVLSMYVFGTYRTMWVLSGTWDYIRLICACAAASAVGMVFNLILRPELYFKLSLCAFVAASTMMVFLRICVRGIHHIYTAKATSTEEQKRLMIVGAGTSAAMLMKDISSNENLDYDVVCLIDDDPNKLHASINGVRVVGTRYDIIKAALKYEIDEIMIAMPSAGVGDRKEIIEICNNTDCIIKTLPSMDQMIADVGILNQIRNVKIEDLLAREPIKLDNSGISQYIENRVILVTGGGGSIGSELCRQIMKFNPKKLVVLDIYENNAYDLQMELNKKYPDNKPDVVIASVRDMARIDDIFRKYRPYIVFHAAAHKHVPLMEDSPGEAVKNNVFGTYNVAKCADKYGVKRFVMISTDKAVNPTNIMGATKRICEMIVQTAQQNSKTEFVCVRFGNVLGSNGSVIPLFKKQIEEGGPVTVTDKRITRFFMTIPEAAQLVIQAASYAKGGEIFVLDMGEPVKIYDLAKNLIRLSGFKPGVDIQVVECGLRPGEKLYEELLMSEEGLANTSHNKIFIGKPIDITKERLLQMLDNLKVAAESDDNERIKDAIAEAVPTYKRPERKKDECCGAF